MKYEYSFETKYLKSGTPFIIMSLPTYSVIIG